MKKVILALVCLVSFSVFSQENIVDVIMDGKPAKLNTTTGVFTFTKGTPSSYATNNSTTDSKPLNGDIHIVGKGETLYSISKKYQLSIAQIKSLNNLVTNVLSVNQELKIGYNTSAKISEFSVYTVKKGDSLYSIARTANITVNALKQLNNLENSIISIGQELKLK